MTKREFTDAIAEKLSGLPEDALHQALDFFSEGIDDRMEDGMSEAQAVAAMGSVDEAAEQILLDTPLPRIVRERNPERKIYIVDSLGASSGYGLLMDKLADLRDEGMSIDAVRDWAEAHKLELHHWFFSTDLTFYVKGGRISKVAGVFGGLLDICPLLNMDNLGRLIPRAKIRGKKRVMKEIVMRMEEHAQGGHDYSGKCYISNSACYDDARAVADEIEQKFPKLNGKVEIYSVGTTIGSHTGPGTVALFFWGDERKD